MSVERVRELSTRLLHCLPTDEPADVALMALVDVAVRIIRVHKGLDAAAACRELGRVVTEIGRAELLS
jgi:hypothetical protein